MLNSALKIVLTIAIVGTLSYACFYLERQHSEVRAVWDAAYNSCVARAKETAESCTLETAFRLRRAAPGGE